MNRHGSVVELILVVCRGLTQILLGMMKDLDALLGDCPQGIRGSHDVIIESGLGLKDDDLQMHFDFLMVVSSRQSLHRRTENAD
jgi:hypothetical protein